MTLVYATARGLSDGRRLLGEICVENEPSPRATRHRTFRQGLRRKIAEANRVIEALPDRPPHSEIAKHLAVLDAAARERATAAAELDRRAQARTQAETRRAASPRATERAQPAGQGPRRR